MLIESPPKHVGLHIPIHQDLKTWKDLSNYLEKKYHLNVEYNPGSEGFGNVFYGGELRQRAGFLWGNSEIPEDEGNNPAFGDDFIDIIFFGSEMPSVYPQYWQKIVDDADIYTDQETEEEIMLKSNQVKKTGKGKKNKATTESTWEKQIKKYPALKQLINFLEHKIEIDTVQIHLINSIGGVGSHVWFDFRQPGEEPAVAWYSKSNDNVSMKDTHGTVVFRANLAEMPNWIDTITIKQKGKRSVDFTISPAKHDVNKSTPKK